MRVFISGLLQQRATIAGQSAPTVAPLRRCCGPSRGGFHSVASAPRRPSSATHHGPRGDGGGGHLDLTAGPHRPNPTQAPRGRHRDRGHTLTSPALASTETTSAGDRIVTSTGDRIIY